MTTLVPMATAGGVAGESREHDQAHHRDHGDGIGDDGDDMDGRATPSSQASAANTLTSDADDLSVSVSGHSGKFAVPPVGVYESVGISSISCLEFSN